MRLSLVGNRSVLVVCAAFGLLAPAALRATPITFDLTLTPSPTSLYGGTGLLTLDEAPAASGVSDFSPDDGTLDDATFLIDGQTFTLAGAMGDVFVRFLDGQLDNIVFAGTVDHGRDHYSFTAAGNYAFLYEADRREKAASFGTFSASPETIAGGASSPVSEPESLLLFGTGLFLCIGLLYRARSPRFTSKAHQSEA